MPEISVNNLSKSYGAVKALDNISLEISKGELYGFIGPDGAGKTTLFRILTTLLIADSGTATVAGHDVVKDYRNIRNLIGYMPGRFSLYQDLSVEENLEFFAAIFNTTIKENYELIKNIYSQIEPFKERRAGQLSGGMKQKLALSCALIHKPQVLFLDEPTTGVDAVSRKEFWEMLKHLQQSGITILVSTPYMDEAGLCDRVALIQNGSILKIDKPKNIVDSFGKKVFAIDSPQTYKLIKDIEQFKHTHSIYPFGQYLHYTDKRDEADTTDLLDYLKEKGHEQVEIKMIKPDIEDCFIELMSKSKEKLIS